MQLVGGFSRGSPLYPAPSFRRLAMFTSITLVGSQDLAAKISPNHFFFTSSLGTRSTLVTYRRRTKSSGSSEWMEKGQRLRRPQEGHTAGEPSLVAPASGWRRVNGFVDRRCVCVCVCVYLIFLHGLLPLHLEPDPPWCNGGPGRTYRRRTKSSGSSEWMEKGQRLRRPQVCVCVCVCVYLIFLHGLLPLHLEPDPPWCNGGPGRTYRRRTKSSGSSEWMEKGQRLRRPQVCVCVCVYLIFLHGLLPLHLEPDPPWCNGGPGRTYRRRTKSSGSSEWMEKGRRLRRQQEGHTAGEPSLVAPASGWRRVNGFVDRRCVCVCVCVYLIFLHGLLPLHLEPDPPWCNGGPGRTYRRRTKSSGSSEWMEKGQRLRRPQANLVRFPAESLPDFRMWGSCRTMPLVDGFPRGLPVSPRPFIPTLLHSHLASPSSALKTWILRAAQTSSLTSLHSPRRLDCSPPTKANRVQSLARSLPDIHRWKSCWTMLMVCGFSRGSPVSPVVAPSSLHGTLISSGDLVVQSRQNLSTQLVNAVYMHCTYNELEYGSQVSLRERQRASAISRPVTRLASRRAVVICGLAQKVANRPMWQPWAVARSHACWQTVSVGSGVALAICPRDRRLGDALPSAPWGRTSTTHHHHDLTSSAPTTVIRQPSSSLLHALLNSFDNNPWKKKSLSVTACILALTLTSGTGNEGRGKREIPEKTRHPAASSGTIPTCESPVARPGIEPGSPWWEASVLIAQPPRPPPVIYNQSSDFDIQQFKNAVFSFVGGLRISGSNVRSVLKVTFRHRLKFVLSGPYPDRRGTSARPTSTSLAVGRAISRTRAVDWTLSCVRRQHGSQVCAAGLLTGRVWRPPPPPHPRLGLSTRRNLLCKHGGPGRRILGGELGKAASCVGRRDVTSGRRGGPSGQSRVFLVRHTAIRDRGKDVSAGTRRFRLKFSCARHCLGSSQVSSPKVSSPKVIRPKISSHEVNSPEVSNPKVSRPGVSSPKVCSPKVSSSKVSNPEVSSPEVCSPKASSLKVSSPKVSSSKVNSPKGITSPKIILWLVTSDFRAADFRATHFWTSDRYPANLFRFPVRSLPCGNHPGRCLWPAGFLVDPPFPAPLHSGASPYSPNFTHVGSQDLDVKNRPNISTLLYT
ncbi:hypothetical protein PR048_017402, partial [Dryococelus australis]